MNRVQHTVYYWPIFLPALFYQTTMFMSVGVVCLLDAKRGVNFYDIVERF